jgi:phenylpyruvate tautomerase PptA (4-oxalocrotonate tautomerase family)
MKDTINTDKEEIVKKLTDKAAKCLRKIQHSVIHVDTPNIEE